MFSINGPLFCLLCLGQSLFIQRTSDLFSLAPQPQKDRINVHQHPWRVPNSTEHYPHCCNQFDHQLYQPSPTWLHPPALALTAIELASSFDGLWSLREKNFDDEEQPQKSQTSEGFGGQVQMSLRLQGDVRESSPHKRA